MSISWIGLAELYLCLHCALLRVDWAYDVLVEVVDPHLPLPAACLASASRACWTAHSFSLVVASRRGLQLRRYASCLGFIRILDARVRRRPSPCGMPCCLGATRATSCRGVGRGSAACPFACDLLRPACRAVREVCASDGRVFS